MAGLVPVPAARHGACPMELYAVSLREYLHRRRQRQDRMLSRSQKFLMRRSG